jgi:hypothetical protein
VELVAVEPDARAVGTVVDGDVFELRFRQGVIACRTVHGFLSLPFDAR